MVAPYCRDQFFGYHHYVCTEPGANGCGQNSQKPKLFGGLARMPLELPHGAILETVKVTWDIESIYPGDALSDQQVIAFYARPAASSGWYGYPDKKNALGWVEAQQINPDGYSGPYTYTITLPANTVVDNTTYTYFVDVKASWSPNKLYRTVVEYTY